MADLSESTDLQSHSTVLVEDTPPSSQATVILDDATTPPAVDVIPESPCGEDDLVDQSDNDESILKADPSPYDVDTDVDDETPDHDLADDIAIPIRPRRPSQLNLNTLRADWAFEEDCPSVHPETPGGTPKTIQWPSETPCEPDKGGEAISQTCIDISAETPKTMVCLPEPICAPKRPLNINKRKRPHLFRRRLDFSNVSDAGESSDEPAQKESRIREPVKKVTPPQDDVSCLDMDFTKVINDTSRPMVDRIMAITFMAIQDMARVNPSNLSRQLARIHDNRSFVEIIYNCSREGVGQDEGINPLFWTAIKKLCIGAAKSINFFAATKYITKEAICPVQYGGMKAKESDFTIPQDMQEVGDQGETKVGEMLTSLGINWLIPGKVCLLTCPIISTTPDYILLGSDPHTSSKFPINFHYNVLGIGECKTSRIRADIDPIWTNPDTTLKDLFFDTKYKSAMVRNIFTTPSSRKTLKPEWIPRWMFEKILASIKNSAKWVLRYYQDDEMVTRDMDMSLADNQLMLKMFTSEIGRQVLMEMITVVDYVDEEYMEAHLYFPSVIDDNLDLKEQRYIHRAAQRKESKGMYFPDGFFTSDSSDCWDDRVRDALDLDTLSDDEEPIRSEYRLAYLAECTLRIPIGVLHALKDDVIVPKVVDTVREIAEKHYLMPPVDDDDMDCMD